MISTSMRPGALPAFHPDVIPLLGVCMVIFAIAFFWGLRIWAHYRLHLCPPPEVLWIVDRLRSVGLLR